MNRAAEKPKQWEIVMIGFLVILLAVLIWNNVRSGMTAQIYLYGESHSQQYILDQELELWADYYAKGMRDLFVEFPYSDAQFLNLWMEADDDELLDLQFQDWAGTLGGTESMKNFLKQIKENYSETVFHGTDVGHTWKSTGQRYLAYLEANGQKGSAEYQRVQENIEQGQKYQTMGETDEKAADTYRESKLVENFKRSYRELEDAYKTDIMGIYGAAHIVASDYMPNNYMADQLRDSYGSRIHTKDLTAGNDLIVEPISTETMTIEGKAYTASYFGKEELAGAGGYKSRRFWRLENAYEDFKNLPTSSREVLSASEYPMAIEVGQVFVVEYLRTDDTTETRYYRADGSEQNGQLITARFRVK